MMFNYMDLIHLELFFILSLNVWSYRLFNIFYISVLSSNIIFQVFFPLGLCWYVFAVIDHFYLRSVQFSAKRAYIDM